MWNEKAFSTNYVCCGVNLLTTMSSWWSRRKEASVRQIELEKQNMVIRLELNFFKEFFARTIHSHTSAYQMNGDFEWSLLKVVCVCKSHVELLFPLLVLYFFGCKWECLTSIHINVFENIIKSRVIKKRHLLFGLERLPRALNSSTMTHRAISRLSKWKWKTRSEISRMFLCVVLFVFYLSHCNESRRPRRL